jgi:2-dehydro-3-deoxyphosphooctonate aldolase (KDO 8-P synthase)
MPKQVKVTNFFIGENEPLAIMCGPCVIESKEHAIDCAKELKKIFSPFSFNFIFKASYDKANRSSIKSFRGPGIDEGLKIFKEIKEQFNLPIVTDAHSPEEIKKIKDVIDIIQIPAFLCRQTDMLLAAGRSNKTVNVKKGQFLSPWEIENVIEKITSTHNENIIITERGFSFGYNNLVSDMRAIPIMKKFGFPVCFDATHSIQLPGGLKDKSGGQIEFAITLAKAAIASGCNALFFEAHPNPKEAKSDASNMLSFDILKNLLKDIEKLYNTVQELTC